MDQITRVAVLEQVLLQDGRLEQSRSNRNHYVAIDTYTGARFTVWVNAVTALERRGRLEISGETDQVVVYRLKPSSKP